MKVLEVICVCATLGCPLLHCVLRVARRNKSRMHGGWREATNLGMYISACTVHVHNTTGTTTLHYEEAPDKSVVLSVEVSSHPELLSRSFIISMNAKCCFTK